MARTGFVVFSLAWLLWIQSAVGNNMQLNGSAKTNSSSAGDAPKDVNDEVIQLPSAVSGFISEGLQEASEKGLVKDLGDHFELAFSPQQEDEFFTKIINKTMKEMEEKKMPEYKVLKEALFPRGSKTMDPAAKSDFIRAIKDAMYNANIIKREVQSTTHVH
ncbi:hypothetical protein V6N13_030133 [Hibiscus sabdariffa]|uniref:Uncharacterized protein n=2 Tax=Hibiscus sabdariffa TaxID=183260 RepID=A0ABR2B148_9ROSI